ncbi:MAG: sulfide/dihydroorotate dehydrogenase-like FAD/NAD-binding protein [Bacilli bacterium]|jgi:ferredoxin--NADP+ reductase
MYRILEKRVLNLSTTLMVIEAPLVARKSLAGQFIILRIDDKGERIPLTIADYDRKKGTITIIFQKVGYSTKRLDSLKEGDHLLDFVGPLGKASDFAGIQKACVIGGGLGVAIAYPQAKALHELGAEVDVIVGFRNKDLIILEEEFKKVSSSLVIKTDDGSNGNQGLVTDALQEKLSTKTYDVVIAIGPLMMMKVVSDITRNHKIKTVVSMNSIMVDGTGMCGSCRIKVNGKVKFACVDGPEFDGHQVDFLEAIARNKMYQEEEAIADKKTICRLGGEGE